MMGNITSSAGFVNLGALEDELRLLRNQFVHASFPKTHIQNEYSITEIPITSLNLTGTTISFLELLLEEVEKPCLEKITEEICTYFI